MKLMLIFISLFFVHDSLLSKEKEVVTWLKWDQAPNFIFEGKFKNQGIGDHILNTLQKKLPEYDHITISANARRYFELIKREDLAVAWAWIVPGSKAFRIYSKPLSLVGPMGLVALKSKAKHFGKKGTEISLEKLIQNKKLVFGYVKSLTYSKKVNDLIKKYKSQSNVVGFSVSGVELNLKLLEKNRVDYYISFSQQATYNSILKGVENKYIFYHISEMSNFTSMHAHVSDTPFGRKLMKKIELILTKDMLLEHLKVIEKWSPKDSYFRKIFIDYIIHGKRSPHIKDAGV